MIITNSAYQFDTQVKLYKDNQLATEFTHVTGPFLWVRLEINETKDWKVENWIKNEKIKEINYSTKDIKDNIYSFLSLAN